NILSGFGNAGQGPLGVGTVAVTVDSAGTILVVDVEGGTNSLGALFTVNPSTGERTILSDFGNAAQGPIGANPRGLTVDSSGTILVVDSGTGPGALDKL